MKKSLIYLGIFAIVTSCNNSNPEAKYQEEKISIEMTEKTNPLNFLASEGTYRPTVFGSKEVLEGTITNTATVASYKNVVLDIVCYDANKQEIGRQKTTIFETVLPNHTNNFKTKIEVPEGTASVGWNINSADAVE